MTFFIVRDYLHIIPDIYNVLFIAWTFTAGAKPAISSATFTVNLSMPVYSYKIYGFFSLTSACFTCYG